MKKLSVPSLGAIFGAAALLSGCGGDGGGRTDTGGGLTSTFSYVTSYGTAAGQLTEPDAIALDKSGNIFVADYATGGTPAISEFDPTGKYLSKFGNTGTSTTGLLSGPQGVVVDSAGNVYVADANNGQIVVFDSTHKFKANLLSKAVGFPYQVTSDAAGNFYVTTSTDLGEVIKFNSAGTILATFGKTGAAGQTLSDPDGVAVDAAGNVFVADFAEKRIVEYNAAGTFVKSFGDTGFTTLTGPQGITINPTLGIFVADLNSNLVFRFDLNGNFIETIGDSSGPGALNHPYDVHFDTSGNLLVADSLNNRVAVFKHKAGAMIAKPTKAVATTTHPTQPHVHH